MRARAEIVARARFHVGHKESPLGSNDSVLIRAWLRRCGITAPAACLAKTPVSKLNFRPPNSRSTRAFATVLYLGFPPDCSRPCARSD